MENRHFVTNTSELVDFFNTIMAQTNQSEYIFSNGFLQQPWEVRSRYIFDMIRHALAKKVNILQRCIHGYIEDIDGVGLCQVTSMGPWASGGNISVDFAKSKERSLTRNLATLSICQMNNVPVFCLAYNSLCLYCWNILYKMGKLSIYT